MEVKQSPTRIDISQKISDIRNNSFKQDNREKNIEREIQLFIAGDMKPKIPVDIDHNRINEYLNNPEFISHLLKKMPEELKSLPEQYKNDKKYVLIAVETEYSVLQHVSAEFRNDKEVISRAIKGSDFLYASGYRVENGGHALQYASDTLKNDKDLVLLAVTESGTAIQYASDALKNDKDVISAALHNTKEAFQYLPENLKNDKKFVLNTMEQFVSQWLGSKGEQLGISFNLPQKGSILAHLSDTLKDDKKVVLCSVKNETEFSLKDVSDRLKNDKDIVLAAIKKSTSNFKYASEELRNDKEVVFAAIKKIDQKFDSELLTYASENLQKVVKEEGLSGLEIKSTSKFANIITTLRDLAFHNGERNTNKYR